MSAFWEDSSACVRCVRVQAQAGAVNGATDAEHGNGHGHGHGHGHGSVSALKRLLGFGGGKAEGH